jgi:hypothetical protein
MSKARLDYLSAVGFRPPGEFTSVALLERTQGPADPERPPAQYALRLLQRYPPGTPYGQVCEFLAELFADKPLRGSHLLADHTGVGQPVLDLLHRTPVTARVIPLLIGVGDWAVEEERGGWRVPRAELTSSLQVLLQARRLRIPPSLAESSTLIRELSTFEVKRCQAGTDSLEAWRQGLQDALVLAVAAACWYGERHLRHLAVFM